MKMAAAPRSEDHLALALKRAEKDPGKDFFSALNQATFQNRLLTHEEKMGFANLTFAGGRDTIIHSISSIIAHFGQYPEDPSITPRQSQRSSDCWRRIFPGFYASHSHRSGLSN
jgi:cytochrome P450